MKFKSESQFFSQAKKSGCKHYKVIAFVKLLKLNKLQDLHSINHTKGIN